MANEGVDNNPGTRQSKSVVFRRVLWGLSGLSQKGIHQIWMGPTSHRNSGLILRYCYRGQIVTKRSSQKVCSAEILLQTDTHTHRAVTLQFKSSGGVTILFKIITCMRVLFRIIKGLHLQLSGVFQTNLHYSCSFLAFLAACSYTKNSPQEFPRICCSYSYMI